MRAGCVGRAQPERRRRPGPGRGGRVAGVRSRRATTTAAESSSPDSIRRGRRRRRRRARRRRATPAGSGCPPSRSRRERPWLPGSTSATGARTASRSSTSMPRAPAARAPASAPSSPRRRRPPVALALHLDNKWAPGDRDGRRDGCSSPGPTSATTTGRSSGRAPTTAARIVGRERANRRLPRRTSASNERPTVAFGREWRRARRLDRPPRPSSPTRTSSTRAAPTCGATSGRTAQLDDSRAGFDPDQRHAVEPVASVRSPPRATAFRRLAGQPSRQQRHLLHARAPTAARPSPAPSGSTTPAGGQSEQTGRAWPGRRASATSSGRTTAAARATIYPRPAVLPAFPRGRILAPYADPVRGLACPRRERLPIALILAFAGVASGGAAAGTPPVDLQRQRRRCRGSRADRDRVPAGRAHARDARRAAR